MTQDSQAQSIGIASRTQQNPGIRFSLKKRPINHAKELTNLSSYNSDFLSGLFADVAKANDMSEVSPQTVEKRNCDNISSSLPSVEHACSPPPLKKVRTELKNCLSRTRASTMNLSELGESSPRPVSGPGSMNHLAKSLHQDSLAFQLNCVSGSNDPLTKGLPDDAAMIAFPNLPATVSDSSCSTDSSCRLTRANLVRQVSNPEISNKESFGWFVDLDDNQAVQVDANLPYSVSASTLAFQAPTAPKHVNNDAEIEWAKAADTVDDVLGDFF